MRTHAVRSSLGQPIRCSAAIIAILAAAPALAQTAPVPPQDSGSDPETEIVVTAPSDRGADIGRTAPEIRLDSEDVATFGANGIGDLLAQLEPLTGPKPVLLVNGRVIPGIGEVAQLPPEAIERVDVLPPEAALAYGYPADQRVVNIVLKREFAAITGEASSRISTQGGRGDHSVKLNIARINGNGRLNIDLSYAGTTALYESERDLRPIGNPLFGPRGNISAPVPGAEIDAGLSGLAGQPVIIVAVPELSADQAPRLEDFVAGANLPNASDLRRYRTLLPSGDRFSLGGTLTREISGQVTATIGARFDTSRSSSASGLSSGSLIIPASNAYSPFSNDVVLNRAFVEAGPLTGRASTQNVGLNISLSGRFGKWSWSANGNYGNARNEQIFDRGVDFLELQRLVSDDTPGLNPVAPLAPARLPMLAQGKSVSTSSTATADFSLNGPVAQLPAGNVTLSIKSGMANRESRGSSSGAIGSGTTRLSLVQTQFQGGITIPIASRRRNVLAAIGDINLSLNGGHDHVSEVGAADRLGVNLVWSPIPQLQFSGGWATAEGLPPAALRGDAVTISPNVEVYDVVNGQSVFASLISGGNPALRQDRNRTISLSARLKLFERPNLSLTMSYRDSQVHDPVGRPSIAVRDFEAAFPDRFVRDPAGRLVSVDMRPLNFERSERRSLESGLVISLPIGGSLTSRAGTGNEEDEGSSDYTSGENRSGRRGRIVVMANHSWQLANRLVIAPGLPAIDLLDASSTNARPQGRHRLSGRLNFSKGGLGFSIDGSWQQGNTLRPGVAGIRFDDATTINLRAFADLGQLPGLRSETWAKGMRLSIQVTNPFETQLRAFDQDGLTPLAYQAAYLDPLGRSILFGVRKQF